MKAYFDKLDDLKENLLKISNIIFDKLKHNEIIVVGSLSIFGVMFKNNKSNLNNNEISENYYLNLLDMIQSPDFDIILKNDPKRLPNGDFVNEYGERSLFSLFEKENGYHIDIITDNVSTLTTGWQSRLIKINNDNQIIHCLDPNDAAVSKLLRGRNNDINWVSIGLDSKLLNAEEINKRLNLSIKNENVEIYQVENAKDFLDQILYNIGLPPTIENFDYVNGETYSTEDWNIECTINYIDELQAIDNETKNKLKELDIAPPYYKMDIINIDKDKILATEYFQTWQQSKEFMNNLNIKDYLKNKQTYKI